MKSSTNQPKLSKRRIAKMQKQAAAFAEQKQWNEAATMLLQLAQNQPHAVELWLRSAQCSRFAHDYFAAWETLQHGLSCIENAHTSSTRTAPENQRAFESLQLALCETLAEMQDWSECEKASRHLLKRAPRHLTAREILATCLLQQSRIAEAETHVRALLNMSPRDPLYRLKLATLLQLSGKSGESLQEFERVVANYPDAPFADEAREAIDLLDNLQIQQVVMRVNEQPQFEQQLRADMTETLRDNGFQLTEEGRESLRHMMSDGRPETTPPKMFLH